MAQNQSTFELLIKLKLSALWIFMLLNMIVRDIHEFGRSGFLEEMMSGVVDGVQLTEQLLLIGGVAMEPLLLMVVLSLFLTAKIGRWVNIIMGLLAVPLLLSLGVKDLDDQFFLAIELITAALIVWTAWRWPTLKSDALEHESNQKSV